MARRNRPAARRTQRSKTAISARLEQMLVQLIGDANDALVYMSSEKTNN